MIVPTDPGRIGGGSALVARLRRRWHAASMLSSWTFGGDWAAPQVDEVCLAVVARLPLAGPLAALGRARARAGVGLRETLVDLAALHAVLVDRGEAEPAVADPDGVPAKWVRLVAEGWADTLDERTAAGGVTDALTGLVTPAYLRTRLRELYLAGAADGRPVDRTHALVAVALDVSALSGLAGWARLVAMTLVGEVLRAVFDEGETHAILRPSVGVVLALRNARLTDRLVMTRDLLAQRLAADPELGSGDLVRVWWEPLPATHTEACAVLDQLGR